MMRVAGYLRRIVLSFAWIAVTATAGEAASGPTIIYVSPEGAPGYWRTEFGAEPDCGVETVCARQAAGKLAEVLANRTRVPDTRTAPIEIRLLTTEPTDDAPTDYLTKGRTLWINSKGDGQSWLRIVGQTRGRLDGTEQVLTRVVGKSLKKTVCDPLPPAARPFCEAGQIAPEAPVLGLAVPTVTAPGLTAPVGSDQPTESLFDALGTERPRTIGPTILAAGSQATRLSCFALEGASHVAFAGVAFRDCWLPAVYIRDSHHIEVTRARIEGSSYAVMAESTGLEPSRTGHLALRESHWAQSPAQYRPKPAGGCDPRHDLDCPASVWAELPWGVVHDRFWEVLNGALFGSRDVSGDVSVTDNLIEDAYNGVRMGLSRECRKDRACAAATNRRVDISGNRFLRIRDNPIEPENHADQWWIASNDFVESHAWISTDGVAGGSLYVVGNVGWFIDGLPAAACSAAGWTDSPVFVFNKKHSKEGYCIPAVAGPCKAEDPDDFNPRCQNLAEEQAGTGRAARGKVLKTLFDTLAPGQNVAGWQDAMRAKGYLARIYLVHNSWYLLKPLISQGYPSPIRHWNNAIQFANCAPGGPASCLAVPPDEAGCEHFEDHWSNAPSDARRALFATCTSFSGRSGQFEHSFDHDAANFDWPAVLTGNGQELNGLVLDEATGARLFQDPKAGDFTPADGRLVGAACALTWSTTEPGELTCAATAPGIAIGAVQPDRRRFTVARPW